VISRPTTATNGALAVRYALGGTGVNGFDYDRLNTSVVIPQGASEVSLRVAPIFRFADKQSKLVSLIIVPEGYMTGASSTASMNTCPSSAL
jgi:hypothetical protein